MLREFVDSTGIQWRVWNVSPALNASHSESVRTASYLRVPAGWLCFESDAGRRRLSPIPVDWETTDVVNLEFYCTRSDCVRRVARDFTAPDPRDDAGAQL